MNDQLTDTDELRSEMEILNETVSRLEAAVGHAIANRVLPDTLWNYDTVSRYLQMSKNQIRRMANCRDSVFPKPFRPGTGIKDQQLQPRFKASEVIAWATNEDSRCV